MTKDELLKLKEEILNLKNPLDSGKVYKHKTAYERFRETALQMPDAKAILYFGLVITYRQLLTLIDNAAKGFSEIGIKYNEVVTMSMLSTPYGLVSFYALDKIGAVMHMVNSATSREETVREIKNFKSKYFVANDIFYGKDIRETLKNAGIEKVIATSLTDGLPIGFKVDKVKFSIIEKLKGINKKEYDGKNIISFEQLLEIGRKSNKEIIPVLTPNRTVAIAYTSGSTGESKAVAATEESIDSMVLTIGITEDKLEPGDIAFTTFPLWIYYSLINMLHEPLCLGAGLALDPLFNPKNVAKRNDFYKFNHWQTIPPYIKAMTKANKKTDCSVWKRILTGGDYYDIKDKLAADSYVARNGGKITIESGYGATECMGGFAYPYYDNPTIGTIGKPALGITVKVIDQETGRELGPNESGIGYIYSPTLMKEYIGNPEATKHNLEYDENGYMRYNTEDLIHYNERGELFHDGRIRRIVLTLDASGNPTKIIPDKTKKTISNIEFIDDCEVITVPDEKRTNRPVAFIVLKSGMEINSDIKKNITEVCKKSLPEYQIPIEYMSIDAIPMTPSKKHDISAMERIYSDRNYNSKASKNIKSKIKSLFRK